MLWPLTKLSDTALQDQGTRQFVPLTRVSTAMHATLVLPWALCASILGGVLNLLSALTLLAMLIIPYWRLRSVTIAIVLLGLALIPYRSTPSGLQNSGVVDWVNGQTHRWLIEWVMRIEDYVYPIAESLRRDMLLGADFPPILDDQQAGKFFQM